MGGRHGVKSPVNKNFSIGGKGTIFWITVPLKELAGDFRSKVEKHGKEVHFQGKLNVLLVEDNELNQKLVGLMLARLGCLVTVAVNGNESIKKLESEAFDLILMDVMPTMDGLEATKIIREKVNKKIPIIGLSANIFKEDIDNCIDSGMNDFLGKPFTETSLQEKLLHWAPKGYEEKAFAPSIKEEKLTNLSFLKNLYEDDQNAIDDMIEQFFNFQNKILEEIEENLRVYNYNKIASLAHKMRSSIKTVGLVSLNDRWYFWNDFLNQTAIILKY